MSNCFQGIVLNLLQQVKNLDIDERIKKIYQFFHRKNLPRLIFCITCGCKTGYSSSKNHKTGQCFKCEKKKIEIPEKLLLKCENCDDLTSPSIYSTTYGLCRNCAIKAHCIILGRIKCTVCDKIISRLLSYNSICYDCRGIKYSPSKRGVAKEKKKRCIRVIIKI